jgi:hypothetical protein
MKMLRNALHHNNLISTSVAAALAIILAVTFWFASSPKVSAGSTCTVCHKRTTTITGLDCGGIDYQRHLDHGDTIGACVTPSGNQ